MKLLHRYCSDLVDRLPNGRKLNFRYPHDRTSLQLAKRIRAHQLGRFTLAHYQSNPSETPDYITTQVCRYRSAARDDFECVSWTVAPVTPERLASWPDRASRYAESDHLVALSDAAGNIVLFEFLDRAQAERTMDAVATALRSEVEVTAESSSQEFLLKC